MSCLLKVCEEFARQNSLKFNSKKSRAIVFTNKRSIAWKETEFSICGEQLSEVREVTHLGHVLSSVIASSTASVKERCRKFYSCLYSIMGSVKGIGTDPDVWSTVMVRVLLPVLGYGCELWDLDSRMNKLLVYQAWRRGFRRGLGLSTTSSLTSILGNSFREAPDLLKRQQLLFFWRACHLNNDVVTNFLYNNPGSLWKKVEPVSRKLIMILSYMDFKSWLRIGY